MVLQKPFIDKRKYASTCNTRAQVGQGRVNRPYLLRLGGWYLPVLAEIQMIVNVRQGG